MLLCFVSSSAALDDDVENANMRKTVNSRRKLVEGRKPRAHGANDSEAFGKTTAAACVRVRVQRVGSVGMRGTAAQVQES